MDLNFKEHQKLLVVLNTGEVYEGLYMYSTNTRLALRECVDHYSPSTRLGVQYYYESEIENVKVLQAEVSEESNEEKTSKNSATTSAQADKGSDDMIKIIKIPEQKFTALQALSKNYIYMPVIDKQYYSAVDHLINSETIGAAFVSSTFDRYTPIQLLILCTWEQVYIFDIALYNCSKFPSELREILENDDVVKVIHDSREIIDCLHHQCRINVRNIFDTYVAAQMISSKNLTLPRCLSYYFNIPVILLQEVMDEARNLAWKVRPLDERMKQYAAQHVTFLITLKNYLQRELLNDFHSNVLKHSRSTLGKQSDVEFVVSING